MIIATRQDTIWIFGLTVIIIFFLVFWCLLDLTAGKTLNLVKNECTNQFTITSTNVVGCSKNYTLKKLENRYLIYQNDRIVQLNTLKNPGEIDLDNSNIKNYPINLISEYKIYEGNFIDDDKIQLKIDEFLGQQKYENNIYDEIDKYISLYQKNYKNDIKKTLDIYMKNNEYFYTHFLLFYFCFKK